MKIKIDQIRTYDDAGFRRRAACLCFRSECESEILLVSSSRFHDLWIVPGGGLEPGEEPSTTAVREVYEEAGVVGRLGRLLDVFENKERNTRTYVYVFVVEQLKDDYEDANKIGRLRKWFSIAEAERRLGLHKPVHREYMETLINDQDHQQRVSLCSNTSSISPRTATNKCTKCSKAYQQHNGLETAACATANNASILTHGEGQSNTPIQQTNGVASKTEREHALIAKNDCDVRFLVNNTDVKAGTAF